MPLWPMLKFGHYTSRTHRSWALGLPFTLGNRRKLEALAAKQQVALHDCRSQGKGQGHESDI